MNKNDVYFPAMNDFYERFCAAVRQSGKEEPFLKKWGLNELAEVYDILSNNVQGGYASHKESMLSGPIGGSVLSIGPGMGFCVFFLSDLYDEVYAAEPDGENCAILQSILEHYPTRKHNNKPAGDMVTVFHAGIAITKEAVRYWDTKAELMKKRKMKGSILNFNIRDAGELSDVFDKQVSRIYLHKVLSSLSIAADFGTVIAQCKPFLTGAGELTWSEPEYIFTDILQVQAPASLDTVLKPVFDREHMDFGTKTYEVSNEAAGREGEPPLVENWTLIKAWR
jgi:hypothetical protein